MTLTTSLDSQVRTSLQCWPERPPGLLACRRDLKWLRGRPGERHSHDQPFLKLPGSTLLRTMPDGLWLGFGGSETEAFVVAVVLEACSSMTNLLDKRSRFAPNTQSLMAYCPLRWLLGPDGHADDNARWQLTGVLGSIPDRPLVVPIRDLRVVYALKQRQYDGFRVNQVPHAHEFFVPMETLLAKKSAENPAIRALFARASTGSNFLSAV